MDPVAISSLEKALSAKLPDWYLECLASYPLSQVELELYDDLSLILAANQEVRRDGWFGFPWPNEFLVIGETGCGDLYFIRLGTSDRRVFLADHEGGPAPTPRNLDEMVSADSLQLHVESIMEAVAQVELWQKERAVRKWWQFWR